MALRIALFGQAAFGADVLAGLLAAGHELVGVYTPPEGRRPDPLADAAAERGLALYRHRRFRRKREGRWEPIPEILSEYLALAAELNVLAYVTAILPPEIVDAPPRRSLCFHPSLLPRYRGGAALAWQIIEGERVSGVTVFQPDEGVDTGPIVVQKGGVAIEPSHTAASLYFDGLYALGVEAMLEAVAAVDAGSAHPVPQDESRASFQGLVTDEVARIDWSRDAAALDRLIRGCDPNPGAWAEWAGRPLRLFDGRLLAGEPGAAPGAVEGIEDGRLVIAARGGRLGVGRVRREDGSKQPAAECGLGPGDSLG